MSFEDGASGRNSVTTDFFTEAQVEAWPIERLMFWCTKINSCKASRKCLRKRTAQVLRRPKHPCVSELVRNNADQPCHGWRALVSANWVGVKSRICWSPRRRGLALHERLKKCSTFSRGEEVRDILPFPLSPEPTKREMQLSMTCVRREPASPKQLVAR